jgi:hypothetical protein
MLNLRFAGAIVIIASLSSCTYITPSILKTTAPDDDWDQSKLSDAIHYANRTLTKFDEYAEKFRNYNAVSATLLKGGAAGGSGVAIFDGPADALKGIAFGAAAILSAEDTVKSKQRFEALNKGRLAIECGMALANQLEDSGKRVDSANNKMNSRNPLASNLSTLRLTLVNHVTAYVDTKRQNFIDAHDDVSGSVSTANVNKLVAEQLAYERALADQTIVASLMDEHNRALSVAANTAGSQAGTTLWGIVSTTRTAIEKQIVADVVDLSNVTNDVADKLKKIREEIIAKYKEAAKKSSDANSIVPNNDLGMLTALAESEAKKLEESVSNCEDMVSGS